MPVRLPVAFRMVLAALPLAGLAACGPKANEFPPACPNPAFLKDLSDISRYTSRGRDLTDLVLRGRLVSMNGKCEEDSKSVLNASVAVNMELTRGPAMRGRVVEVPIFLAVVEGERIVNKQIFPVQFEFPPNVDRATIATPPIAMTLPVSPEKSGAAYGIIAGFQLTPEERRNNRQAGQ